MKTKQQLRGERAEKRRLNQASVRSPPEILASRFREILPDAPGVYRIDNRRSGATYVGACKSIQNRVIDHLYAVWGHRSTYALRESFGWDGIGAFSAEVIELCEVDQLGDRERHWIDALKPSLNASSKIYESAVA